MKNTMLLACALASLAPVVAGRAQPIEGLVAHYPFSGNANDSGPNGIHGTVHGATLAPDRAGHANTAYSFNGAGDYIDLGSSALLRPTDAVTFCLWAYADWTSVAARSTLAGNIQLGGYGLYFDTAFGPVIQCRVNHTVNSATSSYLLADLAPGWHHFAFSSDARRMLWYVDGQLVVAKMVSGPIQYAYANSFLIGAEAGDGALPEGGYYAGSIDEVRIYNRVLSQGEIATLVATPDFPPDLGIERTALLSWETVPGYYRVESAPTADGPWTTVPGTIVQVEGRSQLTVSPQAGRLYYRLVRIE